MKRGYNSKIKNKEELISTINELKNQGKKIVHCHGCFDLVHPGHLRHLNFAKEQGDILLITITGDDFVQKDYMNPFATQDLRAKSLASIEYVDLVYVNESLVANEIIKEIRPDIYIKGEEYAKDKRSHPGFIEEKDLVESLGGKIIYSPGDIVFSSTQIMNKLLQREDVKNEKIHTFLVKHKINKNNLIETIRKYENTKILIVGDFFIEDYVFCDKPQISVDSPILNFDFSENKKFLGGVGLVAQYIQELGGDVKILCMGDETSKDAFSQLNPNLKNKTDFIDMDNYSLQTKTTFLSDERKILELNKKSKIKLDEKNESEFINKIINSLEDVQGIIFCDYGYGFLNKKIINSVVDETRKRGILSTIINNENRFGELLNYKDFDFVVCSEKEARFAVNNFSDGIDYLSRDFLSKTQYKNLIINLGKGGLICYNPLRDYQDAYSSTYASYLPFLFNRVIDGSGKKEALISTITLSLASKAGIHHSLYIGNCVSAIESSKIGSKPTSKEELLVFLEDNLNNFS